ncbi:MAG TPA: hypothetical protein DCP40_00515 [Stenotrophomonas sp.]|nr:hypothetical protein [Stenotrophomonas sp.]
MDLGLLTSAIGPALNALNAARTAMDVRDYIASASAISEAFTKLLDAQQKIGGLITEADGLRTELLQVKEELAEVKRLKLQREKYAPFALPTEAVVYRLKTPAELSELGMDPAQPSHYVCQGCLDNRSAISILIPRGPRLDCPTCNAQVPARRVESGMAISDDSSGQYVPRW